MDIAVTSLPSCPGGVVLIRVPYPDGAIVFHARQHRQVTLTVPPAVDVLLPACTVGAEPPEVGQADELVAVDGSLMGQVRPLVRAAGLGDARDSRFATPHHQVLLAEGYLEDGTGWKLIVDQADPTGTGWTAGGPVGHGSDVRESGHRHR